MQSSQFQFIGLTELVYMSLCYDRMWHSRLQLYQANVIFLKPNASQPELVSAPHAVALHTIGARHPNGSSSACVTCASWTLRHFTMLASSHCQQFPRTKPSRWLGFLPKLSKLDGPKKFQFVSFIEGSLKVKLPSYGFLECGGMNV